MRDYVSTWVHISTCHIKWQQMWDSFYIMIFFLFLIYGFWCWTVFHQKNDKQKHIVVMDGVRTLRASNQMLCNVCSIHVYIIQKVRKKSRECHNHKPQPFLDPKRKRKPTNPNKHKSNKRTKSTKIGSLFPKRGNRNTKRTENTRTKWHTERHTTHRLVE